MRDRKYEEATSLRQRLPSLWQRSFSKDSRYRVACENCILYILLTITLKQVSKHFPGHRIESASALWLCKMLRMEWFSNSRYARCKHNLVRTYLVEVLMCACRPYRGWRTSTPSTSRYYTICWTRWSVPSWGRPATRTSALASSRIGGAPHVNIHSEFVC